MSQYRIVHLISKKNLNSPINKVEYIKILVKHIPSDIME